MVEGQANKEEYYNSVLDALDALLFISVRNVFNSPPPNVQNGERFLVGDSPTGVFSGKRKYIAQYIDGNWKFYEPKNSWVAYNETLNVHYQYRSGFNSWSEFIPTTLLGLSDTPTTYSGKAGMYVRVNSNANGVYFTNDIIIISPNGSKFKLVVSNAGAFGVVNA